MEKKYHIDSLFQQKLTNYEVKPSPQAWQKLSVALDEQKNQRKRRWLWYFFGIGLGTSLIAGATYIYLTPKAHDKINEMPQQTKSVYEVKPNLSPLNDEFKNIQQTIIHKNQETKLNRSKPNKILKINVPTNNDLPKDSEKSISLEIPQTQVIAENTLPVEQESTENLVLESEQIEVIIKVGSGAGSAQELETPAIFQSKTNVSTELNTAKKKGNFWQQIKKIKQGKKVDFKDFNIDLSGITNFIKRRKKE